MNLVAFMLVATATLFYESIVATCKETWMYERTKQTDSGFELGIVRITRGDTCRVVARLVRADSSSDAAFHRTFVGVRWKTYDQNKQTRASQLVFVHLSDSFRTRKAMLIDFNLDIRVLSDTAFVAVQIGKLATKLASVSPEKERKENEG